MIIKMLCALSLVLLTPLLASTKVGNADEGSDLEGARPILNGIIIETRDRAATQLRSLNVAGVRGLGMLMSELETSLLFMAASNSNAAGDTDASPNHGDMRGLVYARTFAVPHAATRFFPVALELIPSQLIALHIHEALHRSLDASIREDETIVSQLTLALTSPDATHDSVAATAARLIPLDPPLTANEDFDRYSHVGYELRLFRRPPADAQYPIDRLHLIKSELYPFGGSRSALGVGIEMSALDRPHGTFSGPLGLSAHLRLISRRLAEFGLLGRLDLNTLSAEELKNSPFGRDVAKLGAFFKRVSPRSYLENELTFQLPGSSSHTIGLVRYQYGYGWVMTAAIRGGFRHGEFYVGGFTQLHLADYLQISGGSFGFDSGRYRILSAGPEIGFDSDSTTIVFHGRFLLDSTKDATFDYLGSLMGDGIAQGSLGLEARIHL